jgi:Holliday junction resolvase RusA-like endonuclease
VRVLPDRRPRYSLWIKGPPLSSQSDKSKAKFYVERFKAEARKQVQGPPLSSTRIDVEIIFATREPGDVDNKPKRILDALKGIVYDDDKQVRTVKSVALKLREGFHAQGFDKVFNRLLSGQEFLVNVYEGGEVDVYLVDSTTPGDEKPSRLMLAVAQVLGIAGQATAGPAGPTLRVEHVEAREPEPREPRPPSTPPPAARS